jgi:hypothetical protein
MRTTMLLLPTTMLTMPAAARSRMLTTEFEVKGARRTLVRFTQLERGDGASWEYFDHAWNEFALPLIRHACEGSRTRPTAGAIPNL